MYLDCTAAEIVDYLLKAGFSVHHPLDVNIGEEEATVALKGGHVATVRRDGRRLKAEVEYNRPEQERLTYHDMLVISVNLEKREETLRQLHADVCGKPGFREVAAAYASDLNTLSDIRRKMRAMLKTERIAQYAAEAEEAANRG